MQGMGTFGVPQLIIVVFLVAIWLPPIAIIVRRAGFSGLWVILAIVPIVNLVALWVFAFVRWPALAR